MAIGIDDEATRPFQENDCIEPLGHLQGDADGIVRHRFRRNPGELGHFTMMGCQDDPPFVPGDDRREFACQGKRCRVEYTATLGTWFRSQTSTKLGGDWKSVVSGKSLDD